MESFIFFIVGLALGILLTKRPIKIEIKRTEVEPDKGLNSAEIKQLEETMFKPDTKSDQMYDDLTDVLSTVDSIMGGSDRQ